MMRTITPLAPVIVGLLLVSACGEELPDTSPEPPLEEDTVAPSVASASPDDGDVGVFLDASIVIAFSEPMDTASVEGAWSSELLPAAAVEFAWNGAGTRLTVEPQEPLDPAVAYTVEIGASAADLAGNTLGKAFTATFDTAAVLTLNIPAAPGVSGTEFDNSTNSTKVWVGDAGTGLQYMSVASFDLGKLPDSTLHVVEATLSAFQNSVVGKPYEKLGGKIRASSVSFTALADADEAEVHAEIGVFSDSPALGARDLDVTEAVRRDRESLESQKGLSQFRFLFDTPTDGDDTFDYAIFNVDAFDLEVTVYMLPPVL